MAVERYGNVLPKTDRKEQTTGTPSKQTRKSLKVVGIKRLEMMVYLTLFIIIAACAFYVLSLKMESYQLQSEVTQLENEITTTQSEIDELNTEVTHLASYDRIYEKANDLGLDLDNGNVKVVENHDQN